MTSAENNIQVVEEVLINKSFQAVHYYNGIVEIIWDPKLELIEVTHLEQIRQVISKLGGGKKVPLYFSFHPFLEISEAARKDATKEEGGRYTLANALLIDNLAKKIGFNFFMNFYKPRIPTRGFSNRADAFHWLEKLQKESK